MKRAAAIDDMSDRVEDVDPAILACPTIADFSAAVEAHPGAVEVEPLVWLSNRCLDDAAPEIQSSRLCEELEARTSTTTALSTTTTDPSSQMIADCVEWVPIGAFVGDPQATDLWTFIQQDESKLVELCSSLYESDPSLVASLGEALEAYQDGASKSSELPTTATSTPPTAPPMTTTPTAPPLADSSGMPYVVCMNLQDAQDLIQSWWSVRSRRPGRRSARGMRHSVR
ncbi:MAG: hypothetical protein HZB15_06670 [Actinobacteria bacterium]|nr:hypothetical protein [Actinomycetota bacterium]